MTIAMIGQKGLPARSGGIERHVSSLAAGLASRGHRVLIYGRRWYTGGGAELPIGVEQRFTRGIHTKHLDAITHSFTALLNARTTGADVIHFHGMGVALLVPLARILCRRSKIIVTFHCWDQVLSKWNWIAKMMFGVGERFACYFAHRVVAVSQTLASYCLSKYEYQVEYIPHTMAASATTPDVSHLEAFGLKKENYLLFVGRLIPDKQAHLLIEAYAELRRTHAALFEHIPLVIVGAGAWTESYAQQLFVRAASVPGVLMLGERCGEELRALQAYALGHVFPTVNEGLSIAMLEAGIYARPMVVTNLPQNKEATGGHVISIDAHSLSSLMNGLVRLRTASSEELCDMGNRVQKYVQRAFHPVNRLDDMERLYREICYHNRTLVTPIAWPIVKKGA